MAFRDKVLAGEDNRAKVETLSRLSSPLDAALRRTGRLLDPIKRGIIASLRTPQDCLPGEPGAGGTTRSREEKPVFSSTRLVVIV